MRNEIGPTIKTTRGYPLIYVFCSLFFLAAMAGVFLLSATDLIHHFRYTALHQHLDALPLITIGLAYATLQIASREGLAERVKGALLALAFLLWGGEQLLPVSRIVTAMDEGAVVIFVLDVASIVWGKLKHMELDEQQQESVPNNELHG